MLSELNIRNIAVIAQADISFEKGFNVFTGETGAGKSILIGAIGAVLGFRTPKELIRTGENKAQVTALFKEVSPGVCAKLSELGIECEGELVINRQITFDSTTCRVNGQAVTAAMLRSVGSLLMNIHGQMDNQMLSSPDYHLQSVDAFGGLAPMLSSYREKYDIYREIEKSLRSVETDARERERKIDLLKFQTEEIDACSLYDGEEEELLSRRKIIRNAEKLTSLLSSCRGLLSGDENSEGAISMLEEASADLSGAGEMIESLDALAQKVEGFTYELEEISREVIDTLNSLEFDPRELDDIEERIDLINQLKRKYGSNIAEILKFSEEAKEELDRLENADISAEELRERCAAARKEAKKSAKILSDERKVEALKFTECVRKELFDLDMPNVVLEVEFAETDLAETGIDAAEFLLSVNPGEAPKPLAKIASGGEMSRIMLAIKNVISGIDDLGTLIFDEIDTGISGRAAQKVGAKLHTAAKDRQILCVTHLAQVAAFADHHLLIEKEVEDGHTFTHISPLEREERVRELARIMSGETITDAALESASDLLDNSN